MSSEVAANCGCGVLVKGDVDARTREFVHQFFFPARSNRSVAPPPTTEFGDICLATLPPDSRNWQVVCPACGRAIPIEPKTGA